MKAHSDKKFVYLCMQRKLAKNNKFKICTKHPLNKEAEILDYQEGIDKIEWELMEYEKRGYKEHNVKETCMAECIAPFNIIPIKEICSILVKNVEDKNAVANILKQCKLNLHVNVTSSAFC